MPLHKLHLFSAVLLFSLFSFLNLAAAVEWKSEKTLRITPEQLQNSPDGKIPVVVGISVNLKGDRLVTVGDDHITRIWSLPSGKIEKHISDQSDWVRCAKFSPNGKYLVTGGMDQNMYCYNSQTFEQLFPFETGGNTVRAIAFSSDNERMAMVGYDNILRLYRLSHRRLPIQMLTNGEDQRCVAFSADGRYLASAGRSGIIRIFDMATNTHFDLPKRHTRRINALAFSPTKGDYSLITGGDDQKIYVWSVENRTVTKEFTYPSGKVSALTFCGTDLIAAGSSNNSLSVWRLNSTRQEPLYYSQEHTGTIAELIWDEVNHQLISCSFDTTVKIWKIDTDSVGMTDTILLR
ncbi:MAG: WD40 repeat domain-containing protein [Planctomycetia bacterium]|nr:WD40 repeat domain-containing protein [Planctomycetia bacterium]